MEIHRKSEMPVPGAYEDGKGQMMRREFLGGLAAAAIATGAGRLAVAKDSASGRGVRPASLPNAASTGTPISGSWENEYGSVATLTQLANGAISGWYSSHTGGTGIYRVVGVGGVSLTNIVGPNGLPTSQVQGVPVSLGIYWRSIVSGPPDPGSHWVSGMSGQWVVDTSGPKIIINHMMIASVDDPTTCKAGTYVDKLIFQPTTASVAVPSGAVAPNPIQRSAMVWVGIEDPNVVLAMYDIDPNTGVVGGTITTDGNKTQTGFTGFTDVDAVSGNLLLQAITIHFSASPFAPNPMSAWSGTFNLLTGAMTLLRQTSYGTAPDLTWVQTTSSGLTLKRVA